MGEPLDLTTPSGRAMAEMLGVFAEFERKIRRERVKAGISRARQQGRPHGRPPTAARQAEEVRRLASQQMSRSEIARRLSRYAKVFSQDGLQPEALGVHPCGV